MGTPERLDPGLCCGALGGSGLEDGAYMGASPGLSLSGDHMAIDADCEHLSAQIEEYILCVGAGAGASGGLTGGWASCPVAIVLVPSPGGWARGELPLLTRGGGPLWACRWGLGSWDPKPAAGPQLAVGPLGDLARGSSAGRSQSAQPGGRPSGGTVGGGSGYRWLLKRPHASSATWGTRT